MKTERTQITRAYWIISLVLFLFLMALSVGLISFQRNLLLEQEYANLQSQINVAVEALERDIQRGNFADIETLIALWAKHVPGLIEIKITNADNHVVASFHRESTSPYTLRHQATFPGQAGYQIIITYDSGPIFQSLNNLLLIAVAGSLLVIILLMMLMWFVMHRFVFVPLRRSEDKLLDLANIDALTQLYNRRAFTEAAETEVQRCIRNNTPLCMAMMDLDHFKQVNDEFGHAIGDLILILFSNETKLLIRPYDILGRVGGEEFALCIPGMTLAGGIHAAERIRAKTAAMPRIGGDDSLSISVSIGVTELGQTDSLEMLLKRADDALYRAKSNGRNRVESI
jgi:diguanylate cyclase (GGDEF)-like protein